MITDEQRYETLLAEHNELIQETASLRVELRRIKEGIKRCSITTMVDGNDMCDHGWMTIREHNLRMHEKELEWKNQQTAV